ncbi:MAG: oligosaccharide flippase family protein [Patescibacteria group bacterium]
MPLGRLLHNKFIRNSFILIFGNIAAGFLGYIFQLLVSRKLTITGYGELQSLTSLISILAVPGAAISFFTIKHSAEYFTKNDYPGNYAFYNWLRLKIYKIAVILTAIFLLFSPLLMRYLHLSSYANLFLTWLGVFFSLLIVIKTGVLYGWQDFKHLSLNSILSASVKLFVGVLLVQFVASVFSALLGIVAAGIFSFLFLKIFLKKEKYYGNPPDKRADGFSDQALKKEIKSLILPILFFTFLISMLSSVDMLMVKNLLKPEAAGFYGAFNILGKIIFWASSSVVAVVLPLACAQNSQNKKLDNKTLFYANALIFIICLSGLAIYYYFPTLIVSLLYGAKYLPMAHNLWVFALISLSLSLLSLEANLAYSRNDFKINYILSAVVILEMILISRFHQTIFAIAISIFCSQIFGYLLSLLYNAFSVKKCQKLQPAEIPPL